MIEPAVGDAAIGVRAFPFCFEAPDGPLSYAGQYVQVSWLIEVPADAPGGFHAASNEMTWEVVVTVTLPRRVTISRVHTIVVHPTAGRASLAS